MMTRTTMPYLTTFNLPPEAGLKFAGFSLLTAPFHGLWHASTSRLFKQFFYTAVKLGFYLLHLAVVLKPFTIAVLVRWLIIPSTLSLMAPGVVRHLMKCLLHVTSLKLLIISPSGNHLSLTDMHVLTRPCTKSAKLQLTLLQVNLTLLGGKQ